MQVIIFFMILLNLLGVLNISTTYGFGSAYTHPEITRLSLKEALRDGFIDRFLKEDIELQDGIDSVFQFSSGIEAPVPPEEIERNNDVLVKGLRRVYPTKIGNKYTGRYLIISGSEAEDHPTERAQHHFHDPVSDKGLDNNYYGAGTLVDMIALFYPPAEQSNISRFFCSLLSLCEPSFNLDGTSAVKRVSGETSSEYPYNYFSWPDTQEYFYRALTALTEEEREHYLALTFFSLGHSLHILEDMGVPAHTRNDFLYDHIWSGLIRGSYLEGYIESHRSLEDVIHEDIRSVSFNHLADFWDGNNSGDLPGLSEYTNHNFLSEGTVFKEYDLPTWISIETYRERAEDGEDDNVRYYTGMTSDSIHIPHLAAVGMLDPYFNFLPDILRPSKTAFLDPYCYRDYEEILIPRVISYVSGLIRYFFRGRLGIIKNRVEEGVTSIKIINLSPYLMKEGIIDFYYDSVDGLRKRVKTFEIYPDHPLMPLTATDTITFDSPPDNRTPGRYIAVFRGRLGEDEAVTGKVFRDRIIFVSDRRGAPEIFSMDMDGKNMEILISNNNPEVTFSHPVLSPDGGILAFHSNKDGSDAIWTLNLSTRILTRITDGKWPDWSPNGRELVFHRNTGEKNDIFIINTEDMSEKRLTADGYNNLWPSWSPDGTKIAYTSQRKEKSDVVVIDLKNMDILNLTSTLDGFDRWKPSWSPDGKKIAYEKPSKIVYGENEPIYVNIHVLNLDSGREENLTDIDASITDNGVWNGTPRWVGIDRLIIESNISGDGWSDIYMIDANGGGFIDRLTNTPGHDGYPFVW